MSEHRLEFTDSENPWAPTAVVAETNERTGSKLEVVGLAEQTGGTSGAAFVRWPDGRESVWARGQATVGSTLRAVLRAIVTEQQLCPLSSG